MKALAGVETCRGFLLKNFREYPWSGSRCARRSSPGTTPAGSGQTTRCRISDPVQRDTEPEHQGTGVGQQTSEATTVRRSTAGRVLRARI